MRSILALTATLMAVASASTRVYDVDVYQNCNAKTTGDQLHGVSQTFVSLVDSEFTGVSWFVGDSNPSGGLYKFEIMPAPAGDPIYRAFVPTGASYTFVCTTLTRISDEKIIKGKEYVLKVTYSGSDSINYYYSPWDPYPYGIISAPEYGTLPYSVG